MPVEQSKDSEQRRVGIVTFPLSGSGINNLQNFIATLEPLASELYVISGGIPEDKSRKIKIINVRQREARSFVGRALNNFLTQFDLASSLDKNLKNIDILFFHIGGSFLVLPMMLVKFRRRKVAIVATGNPPKNAEFASPGSLDSKILSLLERINYRLCDVILNCSENLFPPRVAPYTKKLCPLGARFVDATLFYPREPLKQREPIVAYVGRLSAEKGVRNLALAIKIVLAQQKDVKFFIVGDGLLAEEMSLLFAEERAAGKVELLGLLAHHEVGYYLNKARLLVQPSYTEGWVPNTVLEAMACGTPVLATPVGNIPNIIKDGEIGFILWDNSPQSIADDILKALSHPDLDKIAQNARALIEKEYTYPAAVERYRKILDYMERLD